MMQSFEKIALWMARARDARCYQLEFVFENKHRQRSVGREELEHWQGENEKNSNKYLSDKCLNEYLQR